MESWHDFLPRKMINTLVTDFHIKFSLPRVKVKKNVAPGQYRQYGKSWPYCWRKIVCIRSIIHSVTHSFIPFHSIHSVMNFIIHSLPYSFIHSFIHPFIHSFIHSFYHSLLHLFIHSVNHSFIYSFVCSFAP